MKTASYLLLTWGLLTIGALGLQAQKTVEKSYTLSPQTYVELDMRFPDSVKVIPSNEPQLRIVAKVQINEGKDNDAFYLESENNENTLYISTKFKDEKELFQQQRDQPHGKCYCCDNNFLKIYVEIYMPVEQSFSLEALGSNLIIGQLTGDIRVKATGGFIDMSTSEKNAGHVHLKSIGSSVYSDLKFPTKSNMRFLAGTEIKHQFSGSKRQLYLESIGDDVYLRKP